MEWSLSAATGADACTFPGSATWYVGPIASNPLAARLNKVGITSTAWSYGVIGASNNCGGRWASGNLIGVSQVGDTVTIVSLTDGGYGGRDYSTPLDQITYTLVP